MGRVLSAWDRRLGRDVAWKEILHPDAQTEALLLHEAALTAELDHPGIVPVYDAGRTSDGRLYYTMRLVRGRTLRAVAHDVWSSPSPSLSARLGLVRSLLGAAQAVAFAHGRGVVHRDLKPDNILLGPLGEVQVSDWGLGRRLAELTSSSSSSSSPAGTVGYQAPELLLGAKASPATDVYSLGVVLAELIEGPSSSSSTVGVPAALRAIVVRAQHPDLNIRYADAAALVADLQAFLDDGLVSAHNEGLGDRVVRLWRKHRTAGLVAVVASVVVVVVGIAAFARTVIERDRARAAEVQARAALSTADTRLAQSLVVQARQAHSADRGRDAASLARAVLELTSTNDDDETHERHLATAEARGILSALTPRSGGPGLAVEGTTDVDDLGCDAIFVPGTVSETFACRTGARLVWRHANQPTVDVGAVDVATAAVAWDRQQPIVLVRDLNDTLSLVSLTDHTRTPIGTAVPVETALAIDVDSHQYASANRALVVVGELHPSLKAPGPSATSVPVCGQGHTNVVVQGLAIVDEHVLLLCSDGSVESVSAGEAASHRVSNAPVLSAAVRARLERATAVIVDDAGDEPAFIIGTLRSELLRYRPRTGQLDVLGERPDVGVVQQLTFTHPGVLQVSGSTGAPVFLRVATGAFSGDFGRDDRGPVLVTGTDRFVTFGGQHVTRFMGRPSAPRAIMLSKGLSSIDVDGSGTLALAAGADGLVATVSLADGAVHALDAGLRMTVKQAAFRDDGSIVTGGVDDRGPVVWPRGASGPGDGIDVSPRFTLRRIGVVASGELWGLGYREGPLWWAVHAPLAQPVALVGPTTLMQTSFVDGRTLPDGRGLIGLDSGGVIVTATPAARLLLGKAVGASQVAASVDVDGVVDHVYVAIDRTIEQRAAGSEQVVRRFDVGDDRVTDLAVDVDRRFLVAGTVQGEVVVWRLDTGALWMKAALHTEQVGAVVVHGLPHREGAVAVTTAGWDHRVSGLVVDNGVD